MDFHSPDLTTFDPWLLNAPVYSDLLKEPLHPSPAKMPADQLDPCGDLGASLQMPCLPNNPECALTFSQTCNLLYPDCEDSTDGIDALLSEPAKLQSCVRKDHVVVTSSLLADPARPIVDTGAQRYAEGNVSEAVPSRVSTRKKTTTEKGHAYQVSSSLQVFKNAVANHKRHVTLCRNSLKDGKFSVQSITDSRNRLEKCIVTVSEAFHKLVETNPSEYTEYIDIVNEREAVNRQVLQELTKACRFIEDHITTFSDACSKISS